MQPNNYDPIEFQKQYDDVIARRDDITPNPVTIGTLIYRAKQNGCIMPWEPNAGPSNSVPQLATDQGFNLNKGKPFYSPTGMPPREFAGPEVADRVRLFPMKALSIVVALGGVGKTTFITKLAVHIAAGKDWGSSTVPQRRVLIFNVEETQNELNRKFGAAVHAWKNDERDEAAKNLRQFSCLGRDVRLTEFEGRHAKGTMLADWMIEAAHQFNAEVIFIDHIQGFVDGDLNISDTATALTRAANRIVSETDAAVVFAAHTNKGKINAQEVEAGFVNGSLAFENASRQVIGVIPMPDEDAKKYGLEPIKSEYRKFEISKNSYGPDRIGGYLAKVYVSDFSTVMVEPFEPSSAIMTKIPSADDRVRDAVVEFIRNAGLTTKSALEAEATHKGRLKASKVKVRTALQTLIADGAVVERKVTNADRQNHGIKRQVSDVLEVA